MTVILIEAETYERAINRVLFDKTSTTSCNISSTRVHII